MRIPVLRGLMDHRILVNYRIDPDMLSRLLPRPFSPKLQAGYAIAGICVIRLKQLRTRFIPRWLGLSSDNAAHRIAVEWDENGTRCEGVYIPRRDTSSRWNALAGGRLFPGEHHHAKFAIHEEAGWFDIRVRSCHGHNLAIRARRAAALPDSSVFTSLQEASAFFEAGSLGYSATRDPSRFDGLELRCRRWCVEPLQLEELQSSFFDDELRFPSGTARFDCALLMQSVQHEWCGRPDLECVPSSRGECGRSPSGRIAITPTAPAHPDTASS